MQPVRNITSMPIVRSQTLPAVQPRLIIHAGAGGRLREFTAAEQEGYAAGLRTAFEAGQRVLDDGGAALDAVVAAVRELELNPLFNAGRGATLTAAGTAELDACVATGDGRNGAVTVSRHAKHPVELARVVMEQTTHVTLVDPSEEFVRAHGLEPADQDWFVTDARRTQLANVQAALEEQTRHGTVGAVAVDGHDQLAAATSTGGMVNKLEGRMGDTPVVGAGTFARNGFCGVSCTGDGESFIEGVVAHDVYARMAYSGTPLPDAAEATILAELEARHATGGLIALAADGSGVAIHNSPMMFTAFRGDDDIVTWV